MTTRLLLCTDLDRTLIPNGSEPESPEARPLFARLVARPEVTLAYVTGRHRALVEEAIAEYALPVPDFVIGDVGTSIYRVSGPAWESVREWHDAIRSDWDGIGHTALRDLFRDLRELTLQEGEKQGLLKLSYYAPPRSDPEPLLAPMRLRLEGAGIRARLVWSLDEEKDVGLLDVLPASAGKHHAIEFLISLTGHDLSSTVFAGDSGNDIEVLAGPVPSVLVANGHPAVRSEARRLARQAGHADRFYEAVGGWRGMNGNYSAGILEGVAHFLPGIEIR